MRQGAVKHLHRPGLQRALFRPAHAGAQSAHRPAIAIVRAQLVLVHPLPVKRQKVSKPPAIGLERRIQKSGVARRRALRLRRIQPHLLQVHHKLQRPRVVVRAIPVREIWQSVFGVLQEPCGIRHPQQMLEPPFRQLPRPLIERLNRQHFDRAVEPKSPRAAEGIHVKVGDMAPNHLAPRLYARRRMASRRGSSRSSEQTSPAIAAESLNGTRTPRPSANSSSACQ